MRWFHRGDFYAQCYGSLMGQEGRAICERSLEIGSLGSQSATRVSIGENQDLRSNLFTLSAVSCIITDTASAVKIRRSRQVEHTESLPYAISRCLAVYSHQSLDGHLRKIDTPSITTLRVSKSPWTTSSVCAEVTRASSWVSRSSLCKTASTSLSPSNFLANFSIARSNKENRRIVCQ